jgi:heterodisulfide reductase subunit C1
MKFHSMASLISQMQEDIRFQEGLTACMNCGVCTAICPAAAYFDYDPRKICQDVQTGDEQVLEELLKGEEIWMCGQCLSCKTRCPRNNTPGYIIQVLRKVSQQKGYFVQSRLGRQQLIIKRVIGHSILETGYCVHPKLVVPEIHPEQGPMWTWALENGKELYAQCGSLFYEPGVGGIRKIDEATLGEMRAIFKETGALTLFEQIETASKEKAEEMGLSFSDDVDNDYFKEIQV